MSTRNQDELLELVNSFGGRKVFKLEHSEERWKQSAEKTQKLHREKPWDEVKAIANSSYKVTDIRINRGKEVRKTHHRLETALITVPGSLLITSSNNISVFILFIEFGYFCIFFWNFSSPSVLSLFPFCFHPCFCLFCFVLFLRISSSSLWVTVWRWFELSSLLGRIPFFQFLNYQYLHFVNLLTPKLFPSKVKLIIS